jgi:AcrR family transcriptional regulator
MAESEDTVLNPPDRSARLRDTIVAAALVEFAAHGLDGARVDAIAERASVNKRFLYEYVGNKEALWLAALEHVYQTMRDGEKDLDLEHHSPEDGMRLLVRFNFRFHRDHPEFISILNEENRRHAKALRKSKRVAEMYSPLLDMIGDLLARGSEAGTFRADVDRVQLYISIAALSYFYCSNQHTLSKIFDRPFGSAKEMLLREEHVVSVVMSYLLA